MTTEKPKEPIEQLVEILDGKFNTLGELLTDYQAKFVAIGEALIDSAATTQSLRSRVEKLELELEIKHEQQIISSD